MTVAEKLRIKIDTGGYPARSLTWVGDELVDWAGGGTTFRMDGTMTRPTINWAYRFDKAVASRDGKYAVILEDLGTKALLLRDNHLIREINRSFYCASAYEFPMTILELQTGMTVLIHCPDEYNRLEIEEIESGKKITSRLTESPDFFHSRLATNSKGTHLLSAGWVWHPIDYLQLYFLNQVLEDPTHLDCPMPLKLPEQFVEVNSAAFQGDDHILLTESGSENDEKQPYVARFDLHTLEVEFIQKLQSNPGTILPIGPAHFIGFYEHPKLFEIASGKVVSEWPDLNSGEQSSSMIRVENRPPPTALDAKANRFAIAQPDAITVIQLEIGAQ